MKRHGLYLLISASPLLMAQAPVGVGLVQGELINHIQENYTSDSILDYGEARDVLYSEIDNNDGAVYGVYTNYSVTLDPDMDPSVHLYENGMNCEHIWPQSQYDGTYPMKSDMHNLRPCKENVNSTRSNKPFGNVDDAQAQHWFWLDNNLTNMPESNIDEYSESDTNVFEPREDMKGDIARTVFYFFTIYEDVSDLTFFMSQKDTLYSWHLTDPVSADELERTWDISVYQDNIPNPFIIDESLVYRAYFHQFSSPGDTNLDGVANIVDIVMLVSHILGEQGLTDTQVVNSDLNTDNVINIADITLLIQTIFNTT